MNEQELEGLNKKLAEWAGWIALKAGGWKSPDKDNHFEANFTQSLDACLKHLFPKLVSDNKLWGHFVEFTRWEGLPPSRKRLSDGKMIKRLLDPMFICKTIEKIIDLIK